MGFRCDFFFLSDVSIVLRKTLAPSVADLEGVCDAQNTRVFLCVSGFLFDEGPDTLGIWIKIVCESTVPPYSEPSVPCSSQPYYCSGRRFRMDCSLSLFLRGRSFHFLGSGTEDDVAWSCFFLCTIQYSMLVFFVWVRWA